MTAISFRGQLLWENIKRGDLAAVVNLLESGGINIEEKDENGQTFLMLACERGELAIVRELIENDVDVNAVDNESWSALLCAAREGHLEILIELLERGAVLEHRDLCNWTALMWACYKGKTTVVQELLDRGANPNVKADHNMTCLAWAAGRGYTEVVSLLLQKGAKVNSPDKYGTTPLVWASRKGFLQIARLLLQEGSSVDVAGMNSWTALLAATKGGYTEVVGEILQRNANPNALDKDGFTALTIAAKEGYTQIAQDLLAHGAYVSLRDRDGDSILIHAVKGGHIEAVQALLNKYADVDTQGSDGKTALYWGIEKGHNDIVKLLLNNDAETELATKDNDTPLLRAVKSRNEECVRLLLEKNAKVSTTDKRGDTALHISLRARSKRITELLLRNPKNSRLLYRHNKSGETPYSIDAYYQKGILTQIFGHRNLNANDGENLLGYEIFSSALADILSEPALSTPITVGLYAKWGSGKSFLLGKLQNEMKSFTQQYLQGQFQFTWLLFCVFAVPNALVGLALGLSTLWGVGLGVTLALFLLEYGFLAFIWVGSHRYDMEFACRISMGLCRKMDILKLLLKVLFYMPQKHPNVDVPRVKFLFSDYTRITSAGGEKSLAAMIGTLCDAIEQEHSFIVTRLYRIFKPEPNAFGISGRFKSVCCVPYFVLVIFVLLCLVTGVALLVVYRIENNSVNAVLITVACIVGLAVMGNVYTWGLAIGSLYSPQKSRILQAAEQIESLKVDGFMQKIKEEVDLMSEMVDHMDRFTGNETRLVVVVDGLDSCEQEKVLTFLDTLNTLFSDTDSPFITILAVDPHIIIRGLEQNLCAGFHDTTIHGYDYLRNIVHLPFYLQSQGVKIQKEDYDNVRGSISFTNDVGFSHQDSTVSSLSLAEHKHKKSGYVKKKTTQRQASSSCHTSSFDLSKALFKNDYFSDINPRSMRRLMNIVAVTGRLLRAYNIEFSWYRLAGWINVIEQWPYRVSWIIMFWEEHREIADTVLLWEIYRKIAKDIPASKDVEPLLEIDRNVRKLETFFNNSSPNTPSLNVGDLKKFLPCTINLDPYLRKLIRELQHNVDVNRSEFGMAFTRGGPGAGPNPTDPQNAIARLGPSILRQALAPRTPSERRQPAVRHGLAPLFPHGHSQQSAMVPQALVHQYLMRLTQPQTQYAQTTPPATPTRPLPNLLQGGQQEERLSRMTTEDVCQLMTRIEGLDEQMLPQYQASLRSNNINGVVLLTCDIVELKDEMRMKFGDWQLFRVLVLWLREQDALRTDSQDSIILTNQPSQSEVRETEPNGHCGLSDVKKSRNGESLPDGRSASKQQTEGALKPPMRRNNSILEQVEYESEILREVFEDFELEDDDSSEGESDSLKEPQKTDLNISRSIPDKVPSVRFFVENEEGHVQMGSNPDLGSSSKSADKGAQSSLSAETLVANTDDDQSVSKHASDSQPLLKLAAESRKGRNLLKTNLKSKHCPGSLKGKTISEESQPLEVSSDDDDSEVQPLQSPPNAGVPVKSAKGDDASADVSVASGSCVPSGSGQSSDGDAAVHYYPVTTVSTSSDILVWEPRKGATKEDKSYV